MVAHNREYSIWRLRLEDWFKASLNYRANLDYVDPFLGAAGKQDYGYGGDAPHRDPNLCKVYRT